MRLFRCAVLLVLVGTACGRADDAAIPVGDLGPMRVLAYNVQCPFCNYDFIWPFRLQEMAVSFFFHQPDLVAAQELITDYDAAHFQDALGWNRETGERYFARICRAHCDSAIFYRKSKYRELERGSVWLTNWPPRKILWARLEQKSNGAQFIFASTHFDNHQPNQERSARLAAAWAFEWLNRGVPVILAGDFNSSLSGRATVKDGTRAASAAGFALLAGTFTNAYELSPRCEIHTNHTDPATNVFRFEEAIDHIWLLSPHGGIRDAGWSVDNWLVNYRWFRHPHAPRVWYPSDHWPIMAELSWSADDRKATPAVAKSDCVIVKTEL